MSFRTEPSSSFLEFICQTNSDFLIPLKRSIIRGLYDDYRKVKINLNSF